MSHDRKAGQVRRDWKGNNNYKKENDVYMMKTLAQGYLAGGFSISFARKSLHGFPFIQGVFSIIRSPNPVCRRINGLDFRVCLKEGDMRCYAMIFVYGRLTDQSEPWCGEARPSGLEQSVEFIAGTASDVSHPDEIMTRTMKLNKILETAVSCLIQGSVKKKASYHDYFSHSSWLLSRNFETFDINCGLFE